MVVNENACSLNERSALESIASELAPTGERRQLAKTMAMAVKKLFRVYAVP